MQADTTLEPGHIGPNELEAMAKARPNDMFLKGSGVLKLLNGIRDLERQVRELRAAQAPAASGVPLTDEQVLELRSAHGWSKETIRAIEAAIFRQAAHGITGASNGKPT